MFIVDDEEFISVCPEVRDNARDWQDAIVIDKAVHQDFLTQGSLL